MTDDFIRGLRQDWQSQQGDAAETLRRLRRNRWTPHIVLAFEILVSVGALLVGLWFAWVALRGEQHRLLFALSAAVLLLVVPVICIASVRARRPSLAWDSDTPEAMLRIGIRRADASLQVIRIGRRHLAILAAFVALLWIAQVLGFIQAMDFLKLYSAICAIAALFGGIWMSWREARVRRERDACARLLGMLEAEEKTPDRQFESAGDSRG